MIEGPDDYADRHLVEASYAAHVDAGRVDTWRLAGMPLVMGERSGVRFQDAYSGRWFVNCHCNGGVFNLGHRNPRIVAALRAALDRIDVGNHHLVSAYRAEAAERLVATTGGRLDGVVFSPSGGEAVDLAIKAARATTGRDVIVSVQGAFHGHTGLALATGDEKFRAPFRHHLPGFVQVPYDDVDAMDAAVDTDTAAVLLEAIPATAGFPLPSPGYLDAVARLCAERGALLMIDEVQTGLGRTGSVWYHTQEGIEPDVIVTGKGLGGGVYPIAATVMSERVHRFTRDHPFSHVSTFGGAELGCVVAAEVLDMVTDPAFLARVRQVGERLGEAFADAPFGVRRRGMLLGLVFDDPHGGMTAMKALFDAGVYAFFAGNDPAVLQFKPPLVIDDETLEELIGTVQTTLM